MIDVQKYRFSFEYPSLLDWYMGMLVTFCRFSFEFTYANRFPLPMRAPNFLSQIRSEFWNKFKGNYNSLQFVKFSSYMLLKIGCQIFFKLTYANRFPLCVPQFFFPKFDQNFENLHNHKRNFKHVAFYI